LKKSIQAAGDLKNPDVIWLDKQLRSNCIEPTWNSESLVTANVVLLCVSADLNEQERLPEIKMALHEFWSKRILMALFDGGKKPATLGDIKEDNFKVSNRDAPLESLIKAIHAFVQ